MSEVAVAVRSAPRLVRPDAYEPMPPALYVYRQSTPHGEHTGIVCDVTPEAFLDGRVRGHESVQPDRVDGLARYLATVPQRVELVSTLHRAGPVVRATLARAPALPPTREVDGPDGSRHTVWRIPQGPQTEALCRELGTATHYIADGHHRVAASLKVWARSGRDSRRSVLCVAYPLDGLRLASFDRRVAGPVDSALVRGLLEAHFDVRPAADTREALASGIAVNLDRRWYTATLFRRAAARLSGPGRLITPRPRARPTARGDQGGADPRPDRGSPRGVRRGRRVLFALPPPTLETVIAIADAGEVVPAKSTFFSPKPGSGIFLRAPSA